MESRVSRDEEVIGASVADNSESRKNSGLKAGLGVPRQ